MELIVVGCGRVGAELAYRLYKNGHSVTVIDKTEDSFHELPEDFVGRMVEGEAMHRDILMRAGIESADGIALVTSSDATNAIVGHIARTVYNIPNIIIRNFDSQWRSIHESFGHQIVSPASWGAQRIEELLYHIDGQSVFSAGNGEVELYEFTVFDQWDGMSVGEILPTDKYLVAALTRAGVAILPDDQTRVHAGDILLISTTLEGSHALRERMQSLSQPAVSE
jgi:trk system potassium uptake protein TrkA